MDLQRQLTKALEPHKPAILDFARDLMRIPTENPPGRHYRACVGRICQQLASLGLSYQVVEAPAQDGWPRPNLLSFFGGGRETLYFHGQYDVVPADRPDQFEPDYRDGRLIGRGAADMKAGLAAMIYAVYLLKQQRVPLNGRVGLCIVADEETGGRGGSRYLDEIGLLGEDGIGMVTPEPTGGVIWNANRGAISLRITVKGRAAHVGLQHRGVNAFEGMLNIAAALARLKSEVEQRVTGFHIEPEAAAHSILLLGGQVAGGTNFNVVPETCTFTVDRRINPEESLVEEKARLLSLLDAQRQQGIDLDVEVLQEGISCGVAEEDLLARELARSIESVTGERPRFEMCPGLLEIRWYAQRGIPAFAYGPGLLDRAHGPDEDVDIRRVFQHTLIFALLAARRLS